MLDNLKNGDLVKLEVNEIKQCLEFIPQTELDKIRQFYPNEFNGINSTAPANLDKELIWLFTDFLESSNLKAKMTRLINKFKGEFRFNIYWKVLENVTVVSNTQSTNLIKRFRDLGVTGSIGGGNGNDNWRNFSRYFERMQEVRPIIPNPIEYLDININTFRPPLLRERTFVSVNPDLLGNLVFLSTPRFRPSTVYHISAKCKWSNNTCTEFACQSDLCHTKKTKDYINIPSAYKIQDLSYPVVNSSGKERNFYLSFLDLFSELKAGDVVLLNESINAENTDYPCSFNIAINGIIAYLATKKVSVVLCSGNRVQNLSSQNYPSLVSSAIVVGAVKKIDNRWQFDSNYANGTEIDFYVQTHGNYFSKSSAASAYIAGKIKKMQDDIGSNKLSIDEIKAQLKQDPSMVTRQVEVPNTSQRLTVSFLVTPRTMTEIE